MGIDGFLRQVKDALEERHVRSYSGQTIVVDAFSWLHKACYGCAFELGTGQKTDSYIQYMLRKVELLRLCGVKQAILVFDGQRLPLKALTHGKRQGSKEENRKIALQCLQNAKRLRGDARSEEMAKAYQHFARAVSITQEIVTNVMNALRASDIPFVVAPFEADAQMVWMCKTGAASAIVTEDSDVFLYCIATGIDTHVLFKLDDQGFVQTLSRPSLRKHSEASSNPFMKKLYHLTTGEQDATRMFVQFCALSGCDFLDSLPNMGIVTALKQVFNFRGAPGHLRVQRIVSKLSAAGAKIPPDFLERFAQAESIFFHHVIFNPGQQRCEFLITGNESACIPDIFELVQASLGIKHSGGSDEPFNLHTAATSKSSYLGVVLPADVVSGIYNGSVCPRTLRYLSATHEEPDTVRLRSDLSFGKDLPRKVDAGQETTDRDAAAFVSVNSEDDSQLTSPLPPKWQTKAAKQPSPEAIARKQYVQAKQRDSTFKSLMNVYSKTDAEAQSAAIDSKSPPPASGSSWLLDRVSTAPEDTSNSGAKRKRNLEGSSGKDPQSVAPTTTSFRDLVGKSNLSTSQGHDSTTKDELLNTRLLDQETAHTNYHHQQQQKESLTE